MKWWQRLLDWLFRYELPEIESFDPEERKLKASAKNLSSALDDDEWFHPGHA